MAFLNMTKYKGEYDDLFEGGAELESYLNGICISTEKYLGKMFASPRDFIFIHQAKLNPSDGSIQMPAVSVVDPKFPVVKGYVRGRIIVNI